IPAVPPLRTATSDADRDRHNNCNKAVTHAPAWVPPQRRWPRTIQLFGWPTRAGAEGGRTGSGPPLRVGTLPWLGFVPGDVASAPVGGRGTAGRPAAGYPAETLNAVSLVTDAEVTREALPQ